MLTGNSEWRAISDCGALWFSLVHSVCNIFWDWRCVWQLSCDCECVPLRLSSPLVDSGGIAEAVASFTVTICTSLRIYARTSEVAVAARGCRLYISTTSQVVSERYQRFPKTWGRRVWRKDANEWRVVKQRTKTNCFLDDCEGVKPRSWIQADCWRKKSNDWSWPRIDFELVVFGILWERDAGKFILASAQGVTRSTQH